MVMAAVDTYDDAAAAAAADADAADNAGDEADDADDADASTSSSSDSAATDGGHRAASKWRRRWCACGADDDDGSMRCSAAMQSATPSGGMAMFCENKKSNNRKEGIEQETFTR